jgi:hypothetical protein
MQEGSRIRGMIQATALLHLPFFHVHIERNRPLLKNALIRIIAHSDPDWLKPWCNQPLFLCLFPHLSVLQ